jgi:soluble lytic murein transglycosylase-like protein
MNAAASQNAAGGISASPAVDLSKEIKTDINALIEKYSTQHGLKPEVVRQLIAVASGNDPLAVGNNGNLGLMQLQPRIFEDSGGSDPFDPEQNIKAGTQHLSSMLQRNGGNLSLALAAYNTDPATVKRFGGVPPFADTQSFVGQILNGLGKADK